MAKWLIKLTRTQEARGYDSLKEQRDYLAHEIERLKTERNEALERVRNLEAANLEYRNQLGIELTADDIQSLFIPLEETEATDG